MCFFVVAENQINRFNELTDKMTQKLTEQLKMRLSVASLFHDPQPPQMKIQSSIMVVGLARAGKSTFVQSLQGCENTKQSGNWRRCALPTMGCAFEAVVLDGSRYRMLDLSGQQCFRPLWRRWCGTADAALFVVGPDDDVSSEELLDALTEVFYKLCI